MYFTGELMYVKTEGRRKEIRRGDSLKGILPDERISALKSSGLASDVNPYEQRNRTVSAMSTVEPTEQVEQVDNSESGKSWFGKGKK